MIDKWLINVIIAAIYLMVLACFYAIHEHYCWMKKFKKKHPHLFEKTAKGTNNKTNAL